MITTTCVFGYFLPILAMVKWYFSIVQAVFKHEDELRQQAKKMNVASLRSNADQDGTRAEIKTAKVAVLNCLLWLTAWTPYAMIYLVAIYHDTSIMTPVVNEITVVFAKTSTVWNPIIYTLSHPRYREVFITVPDC